MEDKIKYIELGVCSFLISRILLKTITKQIENTEKKDKNKRKKS